MLLIFVRGRAFRELVGKIDSIQQELKSMAATLNDLKALVAAERTAIESAVALLKGLKQKLDDAIASNDPAALQALSDELADQTADLSQAVVENTPVAPPTPIP